jgi:glycosyltransferase involved in cell wall biosynthesis
MVIKMEQNKKNLVSIIIPSYNSIQWVDRAIYSVMRQTYHPIEILVVDDGSTDGTYEHVKKFFPEVKIIQKPNGGSAAARNFGVNQSKGEFLAFLDADDIWAPNKLEIQMMIFNQFPNCGLCGTESLSFSMDEPEPEFEPAILNVNENNYFLVERKALFKCNILNTSSVVLRRDTFNNAGQFDESLRRIEDYDLWLRISRDWEIIQIHLPLIGYQITPGSLSRDTLEMGLTFLKVLEKWVAVYPDIIETRINQYSISVTRKLLRLGRIDEARDIFFKYYKSKRLSELQKRINFFFLVIVCKIHLLIFRLKKAS